MMSANNLPRPDRRELVDMPTISSAELSGVAFIRACINMTSTHRGLGDDQQIAVEGIVGVALEPAALGIDLPWPRGFEGSN